MLTFAFEEVAALLEGPLGAVGGTAGELMRALGPRGGLNLLAVRDETADEAEKGLSRDFEPELALNGLKP